MREVMDAALDPEQWEDSRPVFGVLVAVVGVTVALTAGWLAGTVDWAYVWLWLQTRRTG